MIDEKYYSFRALKLRMPKAHTWTWINIRPALNRALQFALVENVKEILLQLSQSKSRWHGNDQ